MDQDTWLGLIVFNTANDIVYHKLNSALVQKIQKIARLHGLLNTQNQDESIVEQTVVDTNVLLQIFSPIINSQRIMHCQFDNTYTSFQCENGFNFAFGELLGYTFLQIGERTSIELNRHLGVSISLARYFYGANLFGSQANNVQEELLTNCLNCYEQQIKDEEQAMVVEALQRVIVNNDVKRVVKNSLDAALEQLRKFGHQYAQALLFVSNKFVALESNRNAIPFAPADLVFLALLIRTLSTPERTREPLNRSVAIFLQGVSYDPNSGCVPCIAHISRLYKNIILVQIIEYAPQQVSSCMFDTFFVVQKIVSLQLQGDSDALKPAYEELESFVRQTLEAIKRYMRIKSDELDICLKKFNAKWENLRKKYNDFFKSNERELLVRIESNVPSFIDDLKQLFSLACCDSSTIQLDQLPEVATLVEARLLEFKEFLTVKAERSLSIETYLEDFPGLVHFIFINRSTGQMIAPDFRRNQIMPKMKFCSMVNFAREYLKKGQTTVTWKDKTFLYSYFLWFADQSNNIAKTTNLQQEWLSNAIDTYRRDKPPQFEPSVLAIDYYQHLIEFCFPNDTMGKMKCYELLCMHLGLVTPTCAMEHARRLVATVADDLGEEGL